MFQTCVIMQGPPGSGKSQLAKTISAGAGRDLCDFGLPHKVAFIVSTDHLHHDEDGVYRFKKDKLSEFHRQTQEQARHFLSIGHSVIIDNTNIQAWAARPYVEMAVAAGVPIVFVCCTGLWLNIHGVPNEAVERMRDEVEHLTVDGCLNARYPWEKT